MSEQGICVISSPSKHCVKKILKKMNGKKFRWAYLGEGVSKAVSLNQKIGNKGERINVAEVLQKVAKSLRQPYIGYIGKLGLKQNSLQWWASRLSEKNPYVSTTFLHVCYMKTCIEIQKNNPDKTLVFFVENRATRRAIAKSMQGCDVELVEGFGESLSEATARLKKSLLYKGGFLLTNIYKIIISRRAYDMQKRAKSEKPTILIYTWVDERSFDERGEYQESYLGRLYDYLNKNDKSFVIVPDILRVGVYRKTIAKMAKSEHVFLVPHAFLSVGDIFHVFSAASINAPEKVIFDRFEDMDISDVILDDLKNDRISQRPALVMLAYRLVKRLRENGFTVDTVVYPYENYSWEKILCVAMRGFYPSAYLIGYQHTTVPMMQLNHFFSKDESKIVPLPDRIVTSGRYPRELFIRSGYPAQKVIQGGAIRYEHLLKTKMSGPPTTGGRVVLVTPSIDKFGAAELVWKVYEAFKHSSEYKIIIKCHPVMPFQVIRECLNVPLPQHFKLSGRPLAELLTKSNVLLYTDSTTCIEAIAAGVPPIHVESDFLVDIDPLDFDPTIRPSAHTPQEMVKCAENEMGIRQQELSKKKKMWNDVVSDLFSKVDESVYRLFTKESA